MRTSFTETVEWWTRETVKADPTRLYIFGDNLAGVGKDGQAVIRGLPNAYGVPTKKRPSNHATDFFTDDEFDDNCAAIRTALSKIPLEGVCLYHRNIGRGRALMPNFAPATYAFLMAQLRGK